MHTGKARKGPDKQDLYDISIANPEKGSLPWKDFNSCLRWL